MEQDVSFSVTDRHGGGQQPIPQNGLTQMIRTQADDADVMVMPRACEGKACPAAGFFPGTKRFQTFNFTNNGVLTRASLSRSPPRRRRRGHRKKRRLYRQLRPNKTSAELSGRKRSGRLELLLGLCPIFVVSGELNFVVVVIDWTITTSLAISGTASGFFDHAGTCVPARREEAFPARAVANCHGPVA